MLEFLSQRRSVNAENFRSATLISLCIVHYGLK